MRVFSGGVWAFTGAVTAPRPSAAKPPARKFRRAGLVGALIGRQQPHMRKAPCRCGFCDVEDDSRRPVFIPMLAYRVVAIEGGELSGRRGIGKSACARATMTPTRATPLPIMERDE